MLKNKKKAYTYIICSKFYLIISVNSYIKKILKILNIVIILLKE